MAIDDDTLVNDLPPGGQTRFTSITGAIGNYGMIAGAGVFGAKLIVNHFKKNHQPIDKWGMATIGATCVGSVFGILHGVKEANDIQHYREAVAGKIDELQRHAKADKAKITELYQRVQDQEHGKQAAHAR